MFRRELVLVAMGVAWLSACGGDDDPGGSLADVHGLVLFDGVPVAGVSVAIPGSGGATSGADGTFALTGVAMPYDVLLRVPSSGRVVAYLGVRSAAPRLALASVPGPKARADVSGTLTGGEPQPQPENHETQVCLEVDSLLGQPGSSPANPGTYSAACSWWGAETVDATLLGLQVVRDAATGLPTDYVAYGTAGPLTLADGATVTGQVLALGEVAEATLSGSIEVPEGYAIGGRSLGLGCLRLVEDHGTDSSFAYTTPDVAGAGLVLEAQASSAAGIAYGRLGGLGSGTTGVLLSLPAAPELLEPADLATGVTSDTPFSWTAAPGGTSILSVRSYFVPEAWSLLVVTAGTSVTLPDTSLVGLPLPPAMDVAWRASTVAPLTMAEIVANGSLAPAGGSWTEAVAEDRRLTTAP